jgi:hypothetical protein
MVSFLRKNYFPLGRWLLGSLWLVLLPLLGWGQSTTVVISQVYGGGGNTSANYKNDFVELHNVSSSAVTITGFVLQYATAGNAFTAPTSSNAITLNGNIPAGGYYLVGLGTGGTPGSALPTPDQSNTSINIGAAIGKLVLATNNSTTNITPTSANVIDFIGYGPTASAYEGSAAAPVPSGTTAAINTSAIFRANTGCLDTNQNSTDFLVATSAPRNSATAANVCVVSTITATGVAATSVCAGSLATVNFTYTGSPTSVTALLSDATGSFASGTTTLGGTATLNGGTGSITATIPATVAGGTGYKIRVNAAGVIGTGDQAITINNVAVAPTADQTLATNANGTTLTATETPASSSRQWYYSTTSGSGYTTAIAGAMGLTYTPNFSAAGTYYVVVQTAFGACSVFSNEVKITVVAPAITTGTIAAGPYCVGQNTPVAVSIPFTVSGGAFAAGNVFTAYLSNNLFTGNKIAIGTLSGTGSGTIMGSIAQTTGLNTRPDYRIRVEASSPASALTDNGANLSVASYLDNEITNFNAAAGNAQATLSFVAPPTCVTNVVITIKAGTMAGNKPIAGNTYVPGPGSGTVAFGTGTVLSSGQYVVYNGPATGSITITGLTNGARYTFGLFTTNGGPTGTTGYSDGTTRSVIPVVPATLTEIVVPQYLSGRPTTGSTHTTRLPYVWRVSLGNLAPSTTYKYYTAVRASTDVAGYAGVGTSIETQTAGAFVRLGSGFGANSSSFTTDANGTYAGWFGVEASADARFTDQAVVYPMVVVNGGDGANVATQFLATSSPVTALYLSPAATGATSVRGSSFGTPSNFVLTYDNVVGTGRPLAGTWLENDGSLNTANYAAFYSSVEGTAGAYGLLTPNANSNGIRRVEQRALADGSLVGCAATSATGTWPGGAATASPSGGTTALMLTSGDAPLAAPTLASLSTTSIQAGQTLTLSGTGFSAAPTATVTFAPGGAVAAATVNAAGTSLTVVVPSGAGNGTIAVRNACGLSNSLPTTAAPTSAPGLLLLEDDFDYAAGQPLTSNGWNPVSGTAGTIATTSGNLPFSTFPQGAALSGLPAATSSQASLVAGVAGPLYRSGTARPTAATTLYAAAVVNFSATQTGGDYFLAFANAANATGSTPIYRSRVYAVRASATTFTFQLGLADEAATPDPAATAFNLNTSYLLVAKTETAPSGTETTSLYVLPAGTDLSTEPVAPLITKTGTTTLTAPLNAVVLRQDGSTNATLTLDGIRLATGWGAAVGQPIYTVPAATIGAGNYYSLTANNADFITPLGAINVENSLSLNSGIIASATAAPLTLYPGTSVVGGSASSYVSGPLSRVTGTGAATTTFPIGSGANYRPLVLTATAQTGPATYTATQTEGNAGQSFSLSSGLGTAPLRRVSTRRSYTLTTSNPNSGFLGIITLPFEPNDYVNNPADAGLVIAKRDALAADPADNGKWTNLGHSASTGPSTGPGGPASSGTLTSASFTSFSDFTLGATNDISGPNAFAAINPLPVTLSYFAATRTASGVQVAWATASEQSSDYFVVERSLDGRTFASEAHVAAHGTTAQGHTYASLDAAAPAALLYYRLRQVDLDGAVAYSPVATLDGVLALTLAPNPAHESLRFSTALPTAYTVRNTLGQLVCSGLSAAGPNTLSVADLPAGVYFFELRSSPGRMVRKFAKE